MTYRADRLPPPPKTESFQEIYRWNYMIFELLNGIRSLNGDGIDPGLNFLMYSDDNNSRAGVLEYRIKNLENILLTRDAPSIEELRKELADIKKLIVMEV